MKPDELGRFEHALLGPPTGVGEVYAAAFAFCDPCLDLVNTTLEEGHAVAEFVPVVLVVVEGNVANEWRRVYPISEPRDRVRPRGRSDLVYAQSGEAQDRQGRDAYDCHRARAIFGLM